MSALLIIAGIQAAAAIGSAVYGGIADTKEAKEQKRRAERSAQAARDDAMTDAVFMQRSYDAESQALRTQATLGARNRELQQQELASQTMDAQGETMVAQAMRGVSGTGTMRSTMRQFGSMGRQQTGLDLERAAAFSQEQRARTMLDMGREQGWDALQRISRDTEYRIDDAQRGVQDAYKSAIAGVSGAVVGSALNFGMQGHEAGWWQGGTQPLPRGEALDKWRFRPTEDLWSRDINRFQISR